MHGDCQGGWMRYLEAKAEREAHADRVEANRRNFLRRELEWLRRKPKARARPSKRPASIASRPSAISSGPSVRLRHRSSYPASSSDARSSTPSSCASTSAVGTLSGGERARVALAKTLRVGANLVILDESTNDLNIMTLAALEDALIDYPGALLVVTHDRWFLDRVATALLVFEGDAVVRHEGGWADYQARRAVEPEAPVEVAVTAARPASKPDAQPVAAKQKRKRPCGWPSAGRSWKNGASRDSGRVAAHC